MESGDQYNFSIFKPRNLHGKKNRNVIFAMLAIWAVAVFGFQSLLRAIEKPTPEKTLTVFESEWSGIAEGNERETDYRALLNSLIMVRGKISVAPEDKQLLSDAISTVTFGMIPDSLAETVKASVAELETMHSEIALLKDQEYLDLKFRIKDANSNMIRILEPYTGYETTRLEAPILAASLKKDYPVSLREPSFARLPGIMKLYLTHNQSALTDTKFLGFPFHYVYTAVFLLIIFILICIVYNILIEWRLKKEGIVE